MEDRVLIQAAASYGTPFYLFDLDEFCRKVRETGQALGEGVSLCYAMKANPFLVPFLPEGLGKIEACSYGEYRICRASGISPERVIVSGVLKREEEMGKIFGEKGGLPVFTVESIAQFQMLRAMAEREKRKVSLLLRLTSGNQFGMSVGQLEEMAAGCRAEPWVHFLGIHYFSGTQKRNVQRVVHELLYLDELCRTLKQSLGYGIEHLEYGPGLPVDYFQGEKDRGREFVKELRDCVDSMEFGGKMVFEMGRFLTASCGYYVTEIQELKRDGGQAYAMVDGGNHHLHYDGQLMAMKRPYVRKLPEGMAGACEEWEICGALCTVNDILARKLPLMAAVPGDLLVFERAGAYSMTEGMSVFLSRELPAVAVWGTERGLLKVRGHVDTYCLNLPVIRENYGRIKEHFSGDLA